MILSVLSYLSQRASDAVLNGTEKTSIDKSIGTLKNRLDAYFGDKLSTHFRFGSSTRGTILPRSMDEHSDIDYMIVFKDASSIPQTYLDRLRRFVENSYGRSEIYQSNPTIVLELNHIKFDLVPATESWISGLQIPNTSGGWQSSNPSEFTKQLESRNQECSSQLKPTIRLAKHWNANNDYLFDSFSFEKWIVDRNYWGANNLRDYLFSVFDNLSADAEATQWRKDKINRAKQIVANVREYERQMFTSKAEIELKKLILE